MICPVGGGGTGGLGGGGDIEGAGCEADVTRDHVTPSQQQWGKYFPVVHTDPLPVCHWWLGHRL